ncbi:ABC transporter family substrate-binding protein [Rugosimonospora africana]|uniref:Peptide ABC transporter substrate-binding protein n=1 Tax=Rugosimonospora africana TaxID=556532 RepID=A0A8J3VM68_9ACTN|nr:ABC transporter family substrate-binding protein [Rugosimonospora africana]GIH12009.1 peptide ABC transporter substrate-binding protein [Rugosimonospora africana]
MRTTKGLFGLVAVGVASLLAVSACGGGSGSSTGGGDTSSSFADCATKPLTCNSGTTKQGGTVTYTIEKTISGWNLNSAESNTFDFQEVLDGVLPQGPFINTPDLQPTLNSDLMVSAEQTSTSPQTIVYKINPNASWNDGTPINADDFTYMWKTNNGVDCKTCDPASTAGYDQIQTVTGSDNGKTVTVVFKTPYTDWKGLFGPMYPAHIANQHGDLGASWKWLNDNQPTYSGGPYVITGYQKDASVTETPNPKWFGKTKPSLEKLVFRIITDQNQEVPALQNNEVQTIYPQANADIINQVKQINGVQYMLGKGLQWEHLDLNLKNPLMADTKLRQAIFTTIDRKQLISKTVGQFDPGITPLNNHNFMPNMDGYKDVISSTGQGTGDVAKAKSLLTGAGYTGVGTALKSPSGAPVQFRCSFTQGNVLRQQSCELFQTELQALGIKVTPTPITSLGDTLSSGDYDMIIFAWVQTPFIFSGAYQTWLSTSSSNYGHWTNSQSDALLKDAAQNTDHAKAVQDLNDADQIMANDAYVLPLFQKPTFLAAYSNIVNIRDDATSTGPPYNVQEWGMRAS